VSLPKLEGRTTYASAVTVTVTETPAATDTVTVAAAGNNYLTSSTALLSTIATALNANATLAGTYTLTVDDGTDGATGKVTISATGITSFTLTWNSIQLRDDLGWGADLTPTAASFTSPSASRLIYLPNVPRANPMAPDGSAGKPMSDFTMTVAPSGSSKRLKYSTRYVDTMEYRFLTGRKTWATFETNVNESLQTFWGNIISAGNPYRYHRDRTDDATYVEYVDEGGGVFNVDPFREGWVGTQGSSTAGPATLWNYRSKVIKYI